MHSIGVAVDKMNNQEQNPIDASQDRLEAQLFAGQPEVLEYFADDTGNVQYNAKCIKCQKKCKQSYKAVVKYCPRFMEIKK